MSFSLESRLPFVLSNEELHLTFANHNPFNFEIVSCSKVGGIMFSACENIVTNDFCPHTTLLSQITNH